MLIRISLGLLSFVFVSLFFHAAFSFWALGLSVFFVLLPLADWLSYLLLRKKYKLVSHYLWYYPLVYIPVGAVIIHWILLRDYYVWLFVINSLANFIHATFRTPLGLEWFWPVSKISISLHGNRLTILSEDVKRTIMEYKYAQYEARSQERRGKKGVRTLWEEFSDRRNPMGKKTVTLLVISIIAVWIFWLAS